MHRDHIKEYRSVLYSQLCLSGKLWTYLANLNEQTQSRLELTIEQMMVTEDVTEDLKQHNQIAWIKAINNIRNRTEEIIITKMIYG